MKTKVKKWLVKHGNAICAVAVSLASLSSLCCRGCWYQPEEPEGLKELNGELKIMLLKFMYIQLQDLRYIMRLMEEKRTALQVSMKNLQGHIPMQFQQEHREALQIG